MPMVPIDVDSSTVAITAVISSVVTFGFCTAIELNPGGISRNLSRGRHSPL